MNAEDIFRVIFGEIGRYRRTRNAKPAYVVMGFKTRDLLRTTNHYAEENWGRTGKSPETIFGIRVLIDEDLPFGDTRTVGEA